MMRRRDLITIHDAAAVMMRHAHSRDVYYFGARHFDAPPRRQRLLFVLAGASASG